MNLLKSFVDTILHIDVYLNVIIENYGLWTYLILFTVVFCETGLVVIPFLPGDSLLFAAGAFAAAGSMKIGVLYGLLLAAAILGDTVNYQIGHFFGPKVFNNENARFLKKEHLDKTNSFYEKYGGKTIIIARFVPIVRTFAPFVAGIGKMSYLKFISYNIVGGLLWVTLFIFGGYFFGNLSIVKENFTLVIFGIIGISILPGVVEFLRNKYFSQKETV